MNRAALTLLLLATPCLSAGQDIVRVIQPEIRVGDSWTYRSTNVFAPGTHDIEHRVSFVDGKVILLVTTSKGNGKEADSTWTPDWNIVNSHGGMMFRPHSGVFQFPMKVGDAHPVQYDMMRPRESAAESSTSGSVRVVGWETVQVPAGTFRAIRIELQSMVQRSDRPRPHPRQVTFWYVPEVRRWVKFQGSTPANSFGEELLEYKLNEN